MKKYEILEHKADLKIRVLGKTKKELFANSLLAMTESLRPKIQNLPRSEPKVLLRGPKSPAPEQTRCGAGKIQKIKVTSDNLETLLVDFLSEVLYLIQINKEVYNNVRFKKFSETEIEAEISGQKVESFGDDIKAVTYHNLDIRQEKDGTWQATILFDI